MNEDTGRQSFSVTLSREELLAVLDVLRATTIPGLDREPSGSLTPDQEAFALVVARRALLARNLAQVQSDGAFLLHRELLRAVGTCAYARSSILVYHWPAGEQAPHLLFGHLRGDDVVTHTRPGPVLHRFTLLPSRQELVDQVLAFCEVKDVTQVEVFDFLVPRQEFADARQLASVGNTAAAIGTLVQSGLPAESATTLVTSWAAAPRVSALQTITQQSNQMAQTQEFTLMQDGRSIWWIAPQADAGPKGPIRVRTMTVQAVRDLLTQSLGG